MMRQHRMRQHRSLSNRTRIALACTGILGPTALLCALSAARGQTPTTKPETAAQKYKNIKVLKKLPADQLIPLMHKVSASLGVGCDFCHVINPDHTGFEKDDKPQKGVARKMILMTEEINAHQKVVDNKVTCYTCHHGHAAPESAPPAE